MAQSFEDYMRHLFQHIAKTMCIPVHLIFIKDVIHVMELTSDGHTYVIRFTKENALEALRQLGRWASDSELPFSQRDYTLAAEKIREAIADCDQ